MVCLPAWRAEPLCEGERMKPACEAPDKIEERYALEDPCPSFTELRALLDLAGRHKPLWMIAVLALDTGARADELLRLTLYNFSADFSTMKYVVAKAKRTEVDGKTLLVRKHRCVTLSDWVRDELREYLRVTCRNHEGILISPHPEQRIFPWKSTITFEVAWHKLRKKLGTKNPHVLRVNRRFITPDSERVTHVMRFHALRHIAVSLRYVRNGYNIIEARDWVAHTKAETTNGYLHSAAKMGLDEQTIKQSTLQELLGYRERSIGCHDAMAPQQKNLHVFIEAFEVAEAA